MARVLAVLMFMLLCAAAAMAQLNCANLEGNSSTPIAGTDLPYCQNRSLQCCTAQYFTRRVMEINDSIINNLRDELANDENTVAFMNLQETLDRFVDNDFTNAFIGDIPGLNRLPPAAAPARGMFVNNFAMMLRNNFRINSTNQFNLTMYFRQLTTALNALFIQGIGMLTPLNANQTMCVRMQINDAINQTAINQLINRIGQLRRVSTSLFRIIRWYRYTFLQRLAGFRPLQQCVARFITLRCAACNRNIPMLCRPRCNALVRGCLSSFNQGLRDQYDILWNVTRQIVRRSSVILEEIGSEERDFLTVDLSSVAGFNLFLGTVAQRCSIALPSPGLGRKRRQANNMFRPPNAVMGNATRLMGSIRFGNNGPRFCRNNPVNNCWNGMGVVNRDDINFARDDISDQANNPVESFNVDDLNAQARDLGIPMSEFFMGAEYMETAPENVVVPRGESYSPESPPSGASFIKAAPILLLLLFGALVALF